jgi:hypothetical protein
MPSIVDSMVTPRTPMPSACAQTAAGSSLTSAATALGESRNCTHPANTRCMHVTSLPTHDACMSHRRQHNNVLSCLPVVPTGFTTCMTREHRACNAGASMHFADGHTAGNSAICASMLVLAIGPVQREASLPVGCVFPNVHLTTWVSVKRMPQSYK